MPYTSNPYAPKARMQARNDVVSGRLSVQQVAYKYGVNRSTVWRWVKKAKRMHLSGHKYIWTESSNPHRHPNMLKPKVVNRIIELRIKLKRCAPVIHQQLQLEGYTVSLSSVARALRRLGMVRKKKRHIKSDTRFKRPYVDRVGALVEVDTIHFVTYEYKRFFVYAVIDVFSRMGYAEYHPRASTKISSEVVTRALEYFGFKASVVQTDNGWEFGDFFGNELKKQGIRLRHTRVRRPNDNAHVERFIRTIQEECFDFVFPKVETIEETLQNYIEYYNKGRIHLGISGKKPIDFVAKVLT